MRKVLHFQGISLHKTELLQFPFHERVHLRRHKQSSYVIYKCKQCVRSLLLHKTRWQRI